jgi:hypothetical protein
VGCRRFAFLKRNVLDMELNLERENVINRLHRISANGTYPEEHTRSGRNKAEQWSIHDTRLLSHHFLIRLEVCSHDRETCTECRKFWGSGLNFESIVKGINYDIPA